MIYAMSDIHGCFGQYNEMLKKISFSDSDTLYILGDVVDRGASGMKVLLDIAARKNVVMLRGNHDQEALLLLSNLDKLYQDKVNPEFVKQFQNWLSDGGQATLKEFLDLDTESQIEAFSVIRDSLYHTEIVVSHKTYFLAHTVPEKEIMLDGNNCTDYDFIMGEPDYELEYYKNKIIITGHTPTGFIDEQSVGRIWSHNHHIAIDCGAVFGKGLGCIRLDDLTEYYINHFS